MDNFYEILYHQNPKFPVIFHYDTIHSTGWTGTMHWHEALELLYVTEGEILVHADLERIRCRPGEISVTNSNRMHRVQSLTPQARYHCLILERGVFDAVSIDLENTVFASHVTSESVCALYRRIVEEMNGKRLHYQAVVKSIATELIVELCREHLISSEKLDEPESQKLAMVKRAIRYLMQHSNERITVDQIAEHAGYSKYYFSRTFRALTGCSPVEFLNLLRCNRAEELILDGMSVSSAALSCGFENLSYFSRTFRRYKGRMPSEKAQ